MIRSMTAFGRAKATGDAQDITVEIRSVNSRYFDPSVRLPHSYAFMEDRIRAYVQQNAASRGKIEVTVTVERHGAEATAIKLDRALAEGYIAALRELSDTFGLRDDISVMRVAENRDLFVYEKPAEDMEKEWEEVLPVLKAATDAYVAVKVAEGERTERDFREKFAVIDAAVTKVAALSEADKQAYRARLEARLRQTLSDEHIAVDDQRILTECAIFADKIAVDEEIARLRSHIEAFAAILASNEPAGRKMDFLMQEMNREANTMGSKCCDAEVAHLVVAIKCELEKIREQIQNIE